MLKKRRGQIERVIIPLETEQRWCSAFEFIPPAPNPDTACLRSHSWAPELAFCANSPPQIPFDELASLDAFLKNNGLNHPIVPIKERSLEILGDKKRLDTLANSTVLFAKDRLSLEILCCRIVPEPLGGQADGPVLVLKNAAAFDTFRRWDKEICPTFSAIIYGHGSTVHFRDGVLFLREIFPKSAVRVRCFISETFILPDCASREPHRAPPSKTSCLAFVPCSGPTRNYAKNTAPECQKYRQTKSNGFGKRDWNG